jgi:hypothetical protein
MLLKLKQLGAFVFFAPLVFFAGCKDPRGDIKVSSHLPVQAPIVEEQVIANDWEIKRFRLDFIENELVNPSILGMVEVPFALLKSNNGVTGRVYFNSQNGLSKLRLNTGQQLLFSVSGIPVSLHGIGDGEYAIVFREIKSNKLSLIEWNAKTSMVRSLPIEKNGIDYLLFRGAVAANNSIFIVVYDNRSAKNYLRHYTRNGGVWHLSSKELELPTLEDPAGTHYEMEPPLSVWLEKDGVRVIGGTLDVLINDQKIIESRISDCERVLEAVRTPDSRAVLCNRKSADASGVFVVVDLGLQEQTIIAPKDGIPWKLTWSTENKRVNYQLANNARDYTEILEYDLARAQNGGMLDFGSNNIEGRVAWSQIYYLNGLMDAIYMARRDNKAFDLIAPLAARIRLRLELEIRLLDQLFSNTNGMHTRAFTHDRSPALFAVQTSRALLLFERYAKEFPDAPPLVSLNRLRSMVSQLEGHIEVLADSGETESWLASGQKHLRWPYRSAFYFDGLAVPYNHQNEWSYSLFESYRQRGLSSDSLELEPQREIIRHFLRNLAPNGEFPKLDRWFYWWGHAFDGYKKDSGKSQNMPDYTGDKSLAWISFRTIDLMSVLSGLDFIPEINATKLLTSAEERVQRGEVYPFASRSLLERGLKPRLNVFVAQKYARSGAPWEFSNQPWALALLPQSIESEDPHSIYLNSKVLERLPSLKKLVLGSEKSENALLDYLKIALPFNSGQMIKYAGGELGGKYLAWNLAYDLRATLLAYERTGNPAFLQIFEVAADKVIAVRDDKIGIVDSIRRRPAKAWGSNRYSANKGQWVAWDAFSGMAAYPLARYYVLACASKASVGNARCNQYRSAAEEALDEYSPYWVDDTSSGGGYYKDPYLDDIAPLNHMNTLGLAHIELSRLSNGDVHKDKAIKLATFFKHHWKLKGDNTVEWEYWAGAKQAKNYSSAPEDVTHAQINIHFAYESYKAGFVFAAHDMKMLARTFSTKVARKEIDWAHDVGGGGALVGNGLHEGVTGWVILDEFDPQIRSLIANFVREHPAAFPIGHFSYATGPIAVAHSIKQRIIKETLYK